MASIKWLPPRNPFFQMSICARFTLNWNGKRWKFDNAAPPLPGKNGTRCICNKYDGLPGWILSLEKALCNILSRLSTPPTNCAPVDGIFAPCSLKCNLFSNYDVTNEAARNGKNSSEIWKYKLRYACKNESKMLNKFFSFVTSEKRRIIKFRRNIIGGNITK